MTTPRRSRTTRTLAWSAAILLAVARISVARETAAAPRAGPAPSGPRAVTPANADTLRELRKLLDRGRYRRVDSLATALAERLEKRSPSDSLALAQCLDVLLDARAHSGDPLRPEWIETARRAVSIKERLLGPDHRELAVSLNRLGTLLADDFQLAAAEPCYRRALALNQAAYGPAHPQVARVLVNLAILERDRGDWSQAKKDYQRAMAIWDAALKADFPFIGQNVNSLADAMWNSGEYAGARGLFERGLSIYEKAVGPDYPLVGMGLRAASLQMRGGGDWRGSSAMMLQGLKGLEFVLGADHPDVALAYLGLAVFYQGVGENDLARRLFEKSIAVSEASLGPDHPDLALGLTSLGYLLSTLGQPEEVRTLGERALAIRERAFGPDHPLVASALKLLVHAAFAVGDTREARRLAERALAIRRARLGPDHPDVAASLYTLAAIEYLAGDSLAVVRDHMEQSLRVLERSLGPEEIELRHPLHGLLAVALDQGDYSAALAYARRAQSIQEHVLGEQAAAKMVYHSQLGMTLFLMGDAAGALGPLREDLARVERDYGPDHRDAARIHGFLGQVYAALGQDSAAFAEAVREEEISRRNTQVLIQGLPERIALSASAGRVTGMHLAADLAARGETPDPARVAAAWDLWVRGRLLVLDEIADRRRRASAAGDSAGQRLDARVTRGVERLASLITRGPGPAPGSDYGRAVVEAQREMEDAQRALAQSSASYREHQRRDSIGFREIAGALPPHSALVSYARTQRHLVPDGRLRPSQLFPARYMAFVLRSGSAAPEIVPLGDSQPTDSLIARWRTAASGEIEFPNPRGAEAYYQKVGEALRRSVWDPLVPHLQGAARVFVVPDGAFHLVNLAALPDGHGGYLLESGPVLHYLSSERDLVHPPAPPPSRGGLLAVGGPDFDLLPNAADGAAVAASAAPGTGATGAAAFRGMVPRCGDFASLRFEPLAETSPETRDVAALWSQRGGSARRGESRGPGDAAPLTLIGPEARETAFKQLAPGRRALHLATHGFFLGEECATREQAAIMGPDAELSAIQMAATENPLLVSGLALAGFNRRREAPPGGDDGVLTAEEVAVLDLGSVDWVVLSACDTGVGTLGTGEGVLGLRRAFQIAGAHTIIMSLWKIQDEATRRFMQSLYRARWVRGLPTDRALRAAALEMLHERRKRGESTHPSTWGAFIAVGDWR